jgi:hypothetical protein
MAQNKLKALLGNALTSGLMKFADTLKFPLPPVMEIKYTSKASSNFVDSEYI